jgi:putative ABC transport system permease protein
MRIIEGMFQDLRFAVRLLMRDRGFSALAVLVLAAGIGANVAIFSVVNGVLLEPLPFDDPERLVKIDGVQVSRGNRLGGVSLQDFLDWRDQTRSFQAMAAFNARSANISGDRGPQRVDYAVVSADFFSALASRPLLGRTFLREDDQPGGGNVVVLSYGFWQRYYGGDPGVIGKSLSIDGTSSEIIGVMPPHTVLPEPGTQIWKPIALAPDASGPRDGRWLDVIARLKPDAPLDQAQAELEAVAGGLQQQYPATNRGWSARLSPLQESLVGSVRTAMIVLWGAASFFLLIACANLASLGLERARMREKEIAIRSALGAGRLRIVRQLLTESVLLSATGGVLGLAVAVWGVDILSTMGAGSIPRLEDVRIDGRVLGYSIALSVVTGVVFGLLPALRASKAALGQSLKAASRGLIGSSRYNLHRFAVSGQVALTLVLLVGAGLLIRSFVNLLNVDAGFDPQNLLTARIAPPLASPRPDQSMQSYIEQYLAQRERTAGFYRELLARIASLPGVRSAGAINRMPMKGSWWRLDVAIEGRAPSGPEGDATAYGRVIAPAYFSAMGIPLLGGRVFEESDSSSAVRVAVINQAMSRRYWPGEDPLGRRIRMSGEPDQFGWATIVGVVGDVRYTNLASDAEPVIYVPFSQATFGFFGDWGMTLIIRAESSPQEMVARVRDEALALDAGLPLHEVGTMEQAIGDSVAERRFNMSLLAVFAFLALVLAAVGVYGVISYRTSNRTREIGIRMALGAGRSDVLRMILKEGAVVVLIGVVAGLGGAILLTRILSSLLYEVSATDPATFSGLTLALAAVAMLACAVPALRAARIDPMAALRHE